METITELYNDALESIGMEPITSPTEGSKSSRLCQRFYPNIRDAVQRAHPWNCCMSRATLSVSATAPLFTYSYQYPLPTNPYCLRVLQMEYLDYEFKIEGRMLLTDEAECNILYIARVTEIPTWDALLKQAVAARLASKLAYPLAGSRDLATTMWELYVEKRNEARSFDSQEGTPAEFVADSWEAARA